MQSCVYILYMFLFTYAESLVEKDPVFSLDDVFKQDREHSYARSLEKGLRVAELCRKHNITDMQDYWVVTRSLL